MLKAGLSSLPDMEHMLDLCAKSIGMSDNIRSLCL